MCGAPEHRFSEFEAKFKKAHKSGARGALFGEKTEGRKSRVRVPFKIVLITGPVERVKFCIFGI
jgi:hypothetical protein